MSAPLLLVVAAASPELVQETIYHALGQHRLAVLGIVILAMCGTILKLPRVRGLIGEAMVRRALSRLDRDRYRVLHNVFVPSRSGEGAMTEIDHVVISSCGIFVIETKHYSGWIYGSPGDSKWTRTSFRHKLSFLNPLKQNQGHINALAYFLGLPRSVFHSIVCFTGDATLMSTFPANVITSGLRHHIEATSGTLLEHPEVAQAWERLKSHDERMHKRAVRRQHLARLSAIARQ